MRDAREFLHHGILAILGVGVYCTTATATTLAHIISSQNFLNSEKGYALAKEFIENNLAPLNENYNLNLTMPSGMSTTDAIKDVTTNLHAIADKQVYAFDAGHVSGIFTHGDFQQTVIKSGMENLVIDCNQVAEVIEKGTYISGEVITSSPEFASILATTGTTAIVSATVALGVAYGIPLAKYAILKRQCKKLTQELEK